MSDKDRQKKDGRDKNKKNQARREDNFNHQEQVATSPRQAKDVSNLTDTFPGAEHRAGGRSAAPAQGGGYLSDDEAGSSSAPQSARAHASKADKGK